MSDLVPEEAMRAACDAYDAAVQVEYDAAERCESRDDAPLEEHAEVKAVLAAAPLILAAELVRLADQVEGQPVELVDLMGAGKQYNAGKGYVAGLLRRRARELSGASVLRGEGDRDG